MFDWKAYCVAPRYMLCGEYFGPYSYQKPDGGTVTVLGSTKAIICIDGSHSPSGEVQEFTLAPTRDKGWPRKLPSGAALEGIFTRRAFPFGRTTVAALRTAAGEPLDPEPEEVDRDCPECNGSGLVECYSCGHEDDCEHCGGSGRVKGQPDDPDPVFVKIGDQHFDNRLLAPLVAGLPDGPVALAVQVSPVGQPSPLRLTGDGWQMVAMPWQRGDAECTLETRTLDFTPDAPEASCSPSSAILTDSSSTSSAAP